MKEGTLYYFQCWQYCHGKANSKLLCPCP